MITSVFIMKVYVLLLFVVVHIAICEKATDKLKRKLIIPKISNECRKIKCSTVEEPECVKLTRHDLNSTFHIVVINKCELEYIKCHDDVEAKIVPMKFCGHSNDEKSVNKKYKAGADLKRVKRFARRYFSFLSTKTTKKDMTPNPAAFKDNKESSLNKTQAIKNSKSKNKTLNIIHKKRHLPKNLYKALRMSKKMEEAFKKQSSDLSFASSVSSSTTEDTEESERNKLEKGNTSVPLKFAPQKTPQLLRFSSLAGIAGFPVGVIEYEEHMSIPSSSNEFVKQLHTYNQDINKMNVKSVDLDFASFPMVSKESLNESSNIVLMDPEKKDFYDNCPSTCPSRDVMVCAKCQHGIYKTFVSVCHMRMFTCYHSDEVLQLIARYPCVLSAPYISEPEMRPVGRVVEAADDDKVLRYIMCRDKGKLGNSEDPRCIFHDDLTGNKHSKNEDNEKLELSYY